MLYVNFVTLKYLHKIEAKYGYHNIITPLLGVIVIVSHVRIGM